MTLRCIRILACLFVAAVANAQDPWHPLPTDNNKSAKWEDTVSFLNGAISQGYQIDSGCDAQYDLNNCRGLTTFENLQSSSMCSIDVRRRYLYTIEDNLHLRLVTYHINLADVDPASVTVVYWPARTVTGTKFSPVFTIEFTSLAENSLFYFHRLDSEATGKVPPDECEQKDKKCKQRDGNIKKMVLFAMNQDLAKRIARAIYHASLSCN